MNFNFELILFYSIVVTGVIALIDLLFFARQRKEAQRGQSEIKLPILVDYARSFFPVLLAVFVLRSFLFEPFRIPSGSLEPTLLTGDFILVNKYHYGLQVPVLHWPITEGSMPKRGDIIVFRWPPNPSYDFIKRVVGLPGDKISYVNKQLIINGEVIPNTPESVALVQEDGEPDWTASVNRENLMGVKHNIYLNATRPPVNYKNITVPPHTYFVMGDNRDDSADSRYWGFVPDHNIVGKAEFVWMSWNNVTDRIRFDRIGTKIK